MTLRRFCLACPVLLLSFNACDGSQAVEPAVPAASTGSGGSTIKAPSGTGAIAVSGNRIDVSWQDNSTNETGFEVWRSPGGPDGTFTRLAGTGASVTSYADPGLASSTQYCYRVRAFKTSSSGKTSYSDFSNTACATTPVPGAVQVTTATTGSSPDPDGYFVRMDGGPDQLIGTNASITIAGVWAGEHTVWLTGVAWNCSVDGANPRAISVTSGATTEIVFAVTCGPGNSLQVTAATTGVDFDADGYHVTANQTCWGTPDCLRCPTCGGAAVPVNGMVTISGLEAADYLVELSGVASNCSVSGSNARIVAVPGAVGFEIACGPIPPGTEVCENGLDDDGDGLTDALDPDCQVVCEYGSCVSDFCGAGFTCGSDGCCVPHCGDGAWNGDEGDVDCGGACDVKCQSGQHCWTSWDCASGNCVGGICQPA